MMTFELNSKSAKEIREMLKLIPNDFPVTTEDMEEIFNDTR